MTKKKNESKQITENLNSIQEGFQKVLNDHGIHNLRVSNFRLADIDNKNHITASITAESSGCWKWVCEETPTGQVCHEVWDPNCE